MLCNQTGHTDHPYGHLGGRHSGDHPWMLASSFGKATTVQNKKTVKLLAIVDLKWIILCQFTPSVSQMLKNWILDIDLYLWLPVILTVWLTGYLIDRLSDGPTDRLTDCLIYWLYVWLTDWLSVWSTDSDWLIENHADWQNDSPASCLPCFHTYSLIVF